jgi:hypothetical protein
MTTYSSQSLILTRSMVASPTLSLCVHSGFEIERDIRRHSGRSAVTQQVLQCKTVNVYTSLNTSRVSELWFSQP